MALRAAALVALALLAVYHLLRLAAARCTGGGCDLYIPVSLLLPVLTVAAVAVTAAIALQRTRNRLAWRLLCAVGGAVGVIGPPVAAVLFRDRPDVLVPVATILLSIEPVVALAYSFLSRELV